MSKWKKGDIIISLVDTFYLIKGVKYKVVREFEFQKEFEKGEKFVELDKYYSPSLYETFSKLITPPTFYKNKFAKIVEVK